MQRDTDLAHHLQFKKCLTHTPTQYQATGYTDQWQSPQHRLNAYLYVVPHLNRAYTTAHNVKHEMAESCKIQDRAKMKAPIWTYEHDGMTGMTQEISRKVYI